jgi:hypothetical protein
VAGNPGRGGLVVREPVVAGDTQRASGMSFMCVATGKARWSGDDHDTSGCMAEQHFAWTADYLGVAHARDVTRIV